MSFSVSAWASGCVLVFVCTVVYVDVGDSVCVCVCVGVNEMNWVRGLK